LGFCPFVTWTHVPSEHSAPSGHSAEATHPLPTHLPFEHIMPLAQSESLAHPTGTSHVPVATLQIAPGDEGWQSASLEHPMATNWLHMPPAVQPNPSGQSASMKHDAQRPEPVDGSVLQNNEQHSTCEEQCCASGLHSHFPVRPHPQLFGQVNRGFMQLMHWPPVLHMPSSH
jgi:hypothetical protein